VDIYHEPSGYISRYSVRSRGGDDSGDRVPKEALDKFKPNLARERGTPLPTAEWMAGLVREDPPP
jgi:hypothetical protein